MSGAFVAIMMADQAKARALADQIAARGVRPFIAANSDELYEKAGLETLDVLVISQQLRSFLSGVEIIERLQADFAKPMTVLLAPESMEEDAAVQRLGISHLEPPTSTVESLSELTMSIAEKSLRNRPFVCPRAQRIVSQIEGFEPLSPLILKIAASLRDPSASPESLFADVAADSMASAAILKIVNSSAIGRPQKTSSVDEGIRFLGLRRTISAVLSAGLLQSQERWLARAPVEFRRWYSRRCVLIASVSESFARTLENLPPETAYIHGLLQDAGILILALAHGDRYLQLLERVEEIPHLRLNSEERNQLGTSHADVTAALLRRLQLPEQLATIAGRHHSPIEPSEGSALDQALVRVLQVGEAVANIADNPTPQRLMMLSFLLTHYRNSAPGLCSKTLHEAIARVAELSQVLGLPAPDDDVLAQLKENVRLHDAHEPDDDFDPYRAPPATDSAEAKTAEGSDREIAPKGSDPEVAPKGGAPEGVPAGSPKKPKVLVLEDDAAIAKYIAAVLKGMDIEVVHAAHVPEALEHVEDSDGILCDIHLGGEDGVGAITQIRDRGYKGPVIIISGDGCRSTVERACKARINEYLLKPFTKAQLLAKLEKYPCLVPNSGQSASSAPLPELQMA